MQGCGLKNWAPWRKALNSSFCTNWWLPSEGSSNHVCCWRRALPCRHLLGGINYYFAPGSPADSPLCEECYPALPRLSEVGSHMRPTLSGSQSHWWYGFSFTAAPGGVQGRLGHRLNSQGYEWVLDEEISWGWCPSHANQLQPEALIFLLKRGRQSRGEHTALPWGCHQSRGFPPGVEVLGMHMCEGTRLSSTQIIILLSFAETSVLWTKSPFTGRPLLKASSWTLAVGFSSASFLRVSSSLIMSSNKITTFGSNNDHWLQEGATRARSPARHQSTLEPTRQRRKEVEKRG